MIVISGALAVVAFVLLIAGLVADGLGLVYASIAVSLISAVFLGVGAYQRRGEEVAPRAGTEPATSSLAAEPVRVGASAGTSPFGGGEESSVRIASGDDAGGDASAGTVFVVSGRPRYHVEGCRYLSGKEGEPRSLAEARNEGYTACGICRPDENVSAAVPELALVGGGADGDDDYDDEDVDDFDDAKPAHTEQPRRTAAQRRTAAAGTAKRASARKTTAKKTAAKKATAKKTSARKAAPSRATAKKATAKKSTARKAAPTRTTAKKTAARKAAPTRTTAKKATAKKATAKKTAKKAAKKSTRR